MDKSNHSRDRSKRSRSPYRGDRDGEDRKDVKRRRSRSPDRHKHRSSEKKEKLPFRSQHLHKHDFDACRALFAEYLDLQKDLDIAALDDHELRGRWKSFVGKWNRGELSEGWYDPDTKKRADERSHALSDRAPLPHPKDRQAAKQSDHRGEARYDEDEDDDGYGPTLPSDGVRRGPTLPNFQDLRYKHELAEEDRDSRIADLRYERKQDRRAQKERLEELVPRAEPGSRERQLEKKRDIAMSNRTFAEAKDAGTEEVGEGDLMGDDGIDAYKAKKREKERQKNERELRKEEILRAREVEREERLAKHRQKEEETMTYLRSLAQQRFGGGMGQE